MQTPRPGYRADNVFLDAAFHGEAVMRSKQFEAAALVVSALALVGAPSAFARAGGVHPEHPWNPQHIDGLPSEVRSALEKRCRSSRADHQFASYFENSRVLVLHF